MLGIITPPKQNNATAVLKTALFQILTIMAQIDLNELRLEIAKHLLPTILQVMVENNIKDGQEWFDPIDGSQLSKIKKMACAKALSYAEELIKQNNQYCSQ